MAALGGVSARDALLLLTPGEVYDLFELAAVQMGWKKKEDENL